jgi:hypothetical protein
MLVPKELQTHFADLGNHQTLSDAGERNGEGRLNEKAVRSKQELLKVDGKDFRGCSFMLHNSAIGRAAIN